MSGLLDRETGHYAQELVAAETHEQIVGAHIASESFDDVLKELVAGVVAVLVVDGLETVNIHIGGDEALSRPVGSVNLALQVLESNAAAARAGQLISPGMLAVAPRRLAVALSELTVDGGERSVVFCPLAAERSLLATLGVLNTPHRERASTQRPVDIVKPQCCRVLGVSLSVTSGGELVALPCRLVAVARALVAPMRNRRRLARRVSTIRAGVRVEPALMLGGRHVTVCDSTAIDG
jgi:hypothetical protein